jgi:hypothetical protein
MSPFDIETLRGYAEDNRNEHPAISEIILQACDELEQENRKAIDDPGPPAKVTQDDHPAIAETLHRCCDDDAIQFVEGLEEHLIRQRLPVESVICYLKPYERGEYVGETWIRVKLLSLIGEKPRVIIEPLYPLGWGDHHTAVRRLVDKIIKDNNV